ncbi:MULTISPECIES: Hsp20 family protein [unclassified Collinsella]|uniref:Hsp20 family protein n=1 Tax=unclassified Collinsella TaxID=2637548 RepID=UPI0011C945A1|nr:MULTISPECIES: Hsp20 family protein [unclassified Collinsella]TXF38638.1 Hsp20 family protein [Collinsella sp. BA40]
MASMVPYRSVFGVRPVVPASLFDAFDDMMDFSNNAMASKAFPIDVEDQGDAYEVKAYLTGVSKDDIDVELNEGRLSISVNVEESEENKDKNYLQKEFVSYSATRGVYLKDAACEGLTARYADGVLTVSVPKFVEKKNVTKVAID